MNQAAALRVRWKERADLSTDCEHHARTKEAIMTNAQAVKFQAKSKGQGDSLSLCEHPIQELLARSARSDKNYLKGYLMGTYQCCECGEALVYIRKPPSFSKCL
jgi:hypothetical protein